MLALLSSISISYDGTVYRLPTPLQSAVPMPFEEPQSSPSLHLRKRTVGTAIVKQTFKSCNSSLTSVNFFLLPRTSFVMSWNRESLETIPLNSSSFTSLHSHCNQDNIVSESYESGWKQDEAERTLMELWSNIGASSASLICLAPLQEPQRKTASLSLILLPGFSVSPKRHTSLC